MKYKYVRDNILCILGLLLLFACGHKKRALRGREIVKDLRELSEVIPENISERLSYITDNDGVMEDSVRTLRAAALQYFYKQRGNAPCWSANGTLSTAADSMLYRIQHAEEAGLMPAHYHVAALDTAMERIKKDSTSHKDAALWARLDVMMTDAFMKMASHLCYGVAPRDSITLRRDSLISDTVLTGMLQAALQANNISTTLQRLEPAHRQYWELKKGLYAFKKKFEKLRWDTLPLNYTDTLGFRQLLVNRLVQTRHLDTSGGYATDSLRLEKGIRSFQKEFNLYTDGKAGKKTIQTLNRSLNDWLMQAAVNMDRWRKMPDTMPKRYILVNIPAYHMELLDDGKVVLESKVIVGSPRTRTPVLNALLTNYIMYPFWRVPFSITIKEMLPAIKRDSAYLVRKNLEVIDRDGNAVDPSTIDWSKLGKNYFPYVLRQMDGIENSLGIMKFNFRNKYSVYLHDTNNRGLFSNTYRAMSHGCVRVQQWDSLAMYLIRNDERHPRDTVRMWLERGDKKQVDVRPIPLYMRYFTAAGNNAQLVFLEDIYGEDKILSRQMGF